MEAEGIILDVTPSSGDFDRDFLQRLGHPVLVCHGPEKDHPCPIIEDRCAMVDSAHGVVFQLDLERSEHRVILKRYQETLPDDVPLRVVVREGQRQRFDELLAGVQVWEEEPTVADLDGFAAQVEAADRTR
ncbi:MAG: hypothetical protein U9N84_06145 [Actinomycetota bacterium]|nr:hypothetical protein [Actinomycetota bacterium]